MRSFQAKSLRGMKYSKSRQHYAGKRVRFRARGGLCSNSSQRLGHVQQDCLTGLNCTGAKRGLKGVAQGVSHTSTTATISQGVRWLLASRAQAFTESTACTCRGKSGTV